MISVRKHNGKIEFSVTGTAIYFSHVIFNLLNFKRLFWNADTFGRNKVKNLSVLNRYRNIESLSVVAYFVKDVQGIENHKGLNELVLETVAKGDINWCIFSNLEKVACYHDHINSTFWSLKKLKELYFYHSKEKNWEKINSFNQLEKLSMNWNSKIQTEGLRLENLFSLSFSNCRSIKSYHGVDAKRLVTLRFDTCKNLQSLPGLINSMNLKELSIIGCGNIDSLQVLASLQEIEKLYICGTKIMDGKLSFLLKLPKLKEFLITDYKNYDITQSEIDSILRLRRRK